MGHYTGVALRLQVRKDATVEQLDFFDKFFLEADPKRAVEDLARSTGYLFTSSNLVTLDNKELMTSLDYLSLMICGNSAYLENWFWRVKEEHSDYWLYESRASCKFPRAELMSQILAGVLPALVYTEGDVLYREIYESGNQERIPAVLNGSITVCAGYRYLEGKDDIEHPSNEKSVYEFCGSERRKHRLERHSGFTPPWNYYEIKGMKR